ncbi:MAG: hypothetical protein WBE97_06265 [Candidatus Acidiferrales bacterium]
MLQRIGKFFRRHITSRIRPAFRLRTQYTRSLEEEVGRLRAENRALVNSILGVAGIPPMRAVVRIAERSRDGSFVGARLASPGRPKGRPYEDSANQKTESAVSPLRRRSWQQIGRALERQDALAARRERQTDTETFPTPRRVVARL